MTGCLQEQQQCLAAGQRWQRALTLPLSGMLCGRALNSPWAALQLAN